MPSIILKIYNKILQNPIPYHNLYTKKQNIKILYNKCINITYFLINGEFQMVVVEKQNHLNSFENFDNQLVADSEQVEHFAQDMLL